MAVSAMLHTLFFLGSLAAAPVDLIIVGAGPGGAYAAWRAATSGLSVQVFELSERPGGRVHSMRGQGPQGDLVVEAGAYRFAPKPVSEKIGNITWKIATPLTASIIKELGLPSAVYDPDPNLWDHGLHKIVDEHGHDAGYLTFVERMLQVAMNHGARVHYSARVVSLSSTGPDAPIGVRLESGEEAVAHALLLNVPQRPLLELLRRSHGPGLDTFPRPLYVPVSYPIMKLYIHYDDAWWRNDLGLVAGAFVNEAEPGPGQLWFPIPGQLPAPLQGQYHDGDVRCDGPGGRCRGFLQAFYGNDQPQDGAIGGAMKYYSIYADSLSKDSHVHLDPARPHHRELLSLMHMTLVDFHRAALDAANASARVAAVLPSGGVLSIWSQGVNGINAGCHMPKPGNNPDPADLPGEALAPFPKMKIFVANEAYGKVMCFAEGSLAMAEAAMGQLNISKPKWVRQALSQLTDVNVGERLAPTDPFLLPGAARRLAPRAPAGILAI